MLRKDLMENYFDCCAAIKPSCGNHVSCYNFFYAVGFFILYPFSTLESCIRSCCCLFSLSETSAPLLHVTIDNHPSTAQRNSGCTLACQA